MVSEQMTVWEAIRPSAMLRMNESELEMIRLDLADVANSSRVPERQEAALHSFAAATASLQVKTQVKKSLAIS